MGLGASRSVWLHTLAAAIVLVIAALSTSPGVAYMSDEGAAILQARQLSARHTWIYENPLPDLDPDGDARPFPQGDDGARGRAPYARHPLYPRLLQGAHAVAGPAGYLALSILGTVLAALGAAALARGVRDTLAVPVLWAVALSPLFFDSLVVLAHTLAAAAAAGTVLALVRSLEPGGRRWWLALGALFVCSGLAAALRTEGVFVGLGAAVAALVAALRGTDVRRAAPAGISAIAAAAAVRVGEGIYVRRQLGSGSPGQGVDSGRLVAGRIDGFVETWLLPGDRPLARASLFLAIGMAAFGAGALLIRMGRRDRWAAAVLGAGALAYVARLLAGEPEPVPGLLVAFPLGFAALWLLTKRDGAGLHATATTVTATVIAVAVLLTQYSKGGGVEWGGRYFALALPLAAVPLMSAVMRTWALPDWMGAARRGAAGAVGVATIATVVLAAATMRDTHGRADRLTAALRTAAADAGPATVGRPADTRPVVVTTESLVPQLLWPDFDRYRWLVAERHQLAAVLDDVAAAGLRSFVLLTADPTHAVAAAAPSYAPAPSRAPPSPVAVLVLRLR